MSNGGKESGEFLKHLQDEKLKTQATRSSFVTQKLAYATGLLALGSLKPGSFADLSLLLYLVPLLSIIFDLYILAEDYSVKRIGNFLGEASSDPLEKEWEDYVHEYRDRFAPVAAPSLTTILGIAVFFGVFSQDGSQAKKWWWLLVVPLAAIVITWCLYCRYKKVKEKAKIGAVKKLKRFRKAKDTAAKAINESQPKQLKRDDNSDEERS